VRRSDREAQFEDFVLARSRSLLRLCYLLTGDNGLAEDLLQSALANCFRHWDRAQSTGREEAYVRAAIVNAHIDTVRRRRFKEIITLHLPEARAPEHSITEDRDLLRRALAQLAPRTRAAVVLRHYVGLTEQESALTLDCSVGNVKRLTFRGLAQLRAALEQPQPASAQDPDSPAARRVHRQETP
jgi:RNA polymerase sigma-70 factor (sigma-E family)